MAETIVRKRGRPKGSGKVDPQLIVDAALDALADGGYPALTMRGVARSVGVSLATLQHHFPTKDALWRAAVDHLAQDSLERRSQVVPGDLAGKIATFLGPHSARPGLLAGLLFDHAPGSAQRIEYLARRFRGALVEPTERLRVAEAAGEVRVVDHRAFFALITIGIGSIAGASDAVRSIYGFDLETERGRQDLAAGLADVIGLGLLRR